MDNIKNSPTVKLLATQKADHKISIRIPTSLDQRLNDYAKLQGASKQDVTAEAIALYLDIKTGLYDFNEPAIQRLDQLSDILMGAKQEVSANRELIKQMVQLIIRYTSGANYMADAMGDDNDE